MHTRDARTYAQHVRTHKCTRMHGGGCEVRAKNHISAPRGRARIGASAGHSNEGSDKGWQRTVRTCAGLGLGLKGDRERRA
eukprot:6194507-Pleurochrysis_carterae.AAC.1